MGEFITVCDTSELEAGEGTMADAGGETEPSAAVDEALEGLAS